MLKVVPDTTEVLYAETARVERHALPYAYLTHAALAAGSPAAAPPGAVLRDLGVRRLGLLALTDAGEQYVLPYGYVSHVSVVGNELRLFAAGWVLAVRTSRAREVHGLLATGRIASVARSLGVPDDGTAPKILSVSCYPEPSGDDDDEPAAVKGLQIHAGGWVVEAAFAAGGCDPAAIEAIASGRLADLRPDVLPDESMKHVIRSVHVRKQS